jgi:hypothetical protein
VINLLPVFIVHSALHLLADWVESGVVLFISLHPLVTVIDHFLVLRLQFRLFTLLLVVEQVDKQLEKWGITSCCTKSEQLVGFIDLMDKHLPFAILWVLSCPGHDLISLRMYCLNQKQHFFLNFSNVICVQVLDQMPDIKLLNPIPELTYESLR